MADRQTDKATWWSVTAFNDEIAKLEDAKSYPPEVKKVYGGREKCPTSGREHFQGCVVLNSQQRLSWFKSWLPTAHLEAAKHKEALKKYAMKEDTATGLKLERENPTKHFTADEMCKLLASKVYDEEYDDPKELFWKAVRRILIENPKMAGQLMNPSLKGFWVETRQVWLDLAKHEEEEMRKIMTNADEWETL